MTYNLDFMPQALKEWKKLNPVTKAQFQAKLQERLNQPLIKKDKLHG